APLAAIDSSNQHSSATSNIANRNAHAALYKHPPTVDPYPYPPTTFDNVDTKASTNQDDASHFSGEFVSHPGDFHHPGYPLRPPPHDPVEFEHRTPVYFYQFPPIISNDHYFEYLLSAVDRVDTHANFPTFLPPTNTHSNASDIAPDCPNI
ncbi:hypothetical protein C0991_010251, partial [Blastosporella zonata]